MECYKLSFHFLRRKMFQAVTKSQHQHLVIAKTGLDIDNLAFFLTLHFFWAFSNVFHTEKQRPKRPKSSGEPQIACKIQWHLPAAPESIRPRRKPSAAHELPKAGYSVMVGNGYNGHKTSDLTNTDGDLSPAKRYLAEWSADVSYKKSQNNM